MSKKSGYAASQTKKNFDKAKANTKKPFVDTYTSTYSIPPALGAPLLSKDQLHRAMDVINCAIEDQITWVQTKFSISGFSNNGNQATYNFSTQSFEEVSNVHSVRSFLNGNQLVGYINLNSAKPMTQEEWMGAVDSWSEIECLRRIMDGSSKGVF